VKNHYFVSIVELNIKCRCINISAFSGSSPINRRTNQNLPCWRFTLCRYSPTRLSSVLLLGDIFTCRQQANHPTVFFGAHTSTDNQPATRWPRNNKGELQLSILYSTSISLNQYSSAYVVSQRILTSTLFTVLTVENDMTLSCQVYHTTSLTPQLTVFACNTVPPMQLTDRDSELKAR